MKHISRQCEATKNEITIEDFIRKERKILIKEIENLRKEAEEKNKIKGRE